MTTPTDGVDPQIKTKSILAVLGSWANLPNSPIGIYGTKHNPTNEMKGLVKL